MVVCCEWTASFSWPSAATTQYNARRQRRQHHAKQRFTCNRRRGRQIAYAACLHRRRPTLHMQYRLRVLCMELRRDESFRPPGLRFYLPLANFLSRSKAHSWRGPTTPPIVKAITAATRDPGCAGSFMLHKRLRAREWMPAPTAELALYCDRSCAPVQSPWDLCALGILRWTPCQDAGLYWTYAVSQPEGLRPGTLTALVRRGLAKSSLMEQLC